MRITAKVDYAVRAAAEMAADPGGPIKGEAIAERQEIPAKFLENILADLRRPASSAASGGPTAGTGWPETAAEVTVADVIRAVEGPLADVHGTPPETVEYGGAATHLQACRRPGPRCARARGGHAGRRRRRDPSGLGGLLPRRAGRLGPPLSGRGWCHRRPGWGSDPRPRASVDHLCPAGSTSS